MKSFVSELTKALVTQRLCPYNLCQRKYSPLKQKNHKNATIKILKDTLKQKSGSRKIVNIGDYKIGKVCIQILVCSTLRST